MEVHVAPVEAEKYLHKAIVLDHADGCTLHMKLNGTHVVDSTSYLGTVATYLHVLYSGPQNLSAARRILVHFCVPYMYLRSYMYVGTRELILSILHVRSTSTRIPS